MESVSEALTLRPLAPGDGERLSQAFREIGWSKPASLFATYCEEEAVGERWTCVAEWGGALAGYVTVAWSSSDPELRRQAIPEIMDLNVLPRWQGRGIGSTLLDRAEAEARKKSASVGLRMGLHSGYGGAQRLYVRRGYVPDGTGALHGGRPIKEGAEVRFDDDVTLRMVKRFER